MSSVPSQRSTFAVEPAGLQLGQSVAPSGAAQENRRLVADELAAAAREDGRQAGQACPLLLAAAGRGASAPATVLGHAAADLGVADAIRLALSHCGYKIWSRRRRVGIVSKKSITRQQPGRVRRARNEPSEPHSLAAVFAGGTFVASECRRSVKCASQSPKLEISDKK